MIQQSVETESTITAPVLSKLLEADSALAEQEAAILTQVEAIREKRQSLQVVIDIFQNSDTPSDVPMGKARSETIDALIETNFAEIQESDAPSNNKTTAKKEPKPSKSPKSSSKKRKSAKSKPSPKTVADWQGYVKAEYSTGEFSLPDTVTRILADQPETIFQVSDLMQLIFTDDMPQNVRTKAHNRVSNILSFGARNDRWYRPTAGFYSMSKTATK